MLGRTSDKFFKLIPLNIISEKKKYIFEQKNYLSKCFRQKLSLFSHAQQVEP